MMVIEIMSADELMRYGKPVTTLEQCLTDRLRESLSILEAYEDVLYSSGRGYINTPEELEAYLDDVEGEAAKGKGKEDYEDYKDFFKDIVAHFEDTNGNYPCAEPHDMTLREAIKEELTYAKFYTPEGER